MCTYAYTETQHVGGIAFKTLPTYTHKIPAGTNQGSGTMKTMTTLSGSVWLNNFQLHLFIVLISSTQHFVSTSSKVQLICARVVLMAMFNAKHCLLQLHTVSSVCLLSSTHIFTFAQTHTIRHTHICMKILSQCCLLNKFHFKHWVKAVTARNLSRAPHHS